MSAWQRHVSYQGENKQEAVDLCVNRAVVVSLLHELASRVPTRKDIGLLAAGTARGASCSLVAIEVRGALLCLACFGVGKRAFHPVVQQ